MARYVNVLYAICKCTLQDGSSLPAIISHLLTGPCASPAGDTAMRKQEISLSRSSTQLERDRTLHEQQTQLFSAL